MAAPTAAGDGIPPIQLGDVFHQSRSFWSSVLPAGQALTPARTPEIASNDSLSEEALGTAFRQAAADWRAAGADTSGITVSVRDLPGHLLGLAHGTDVAIDDDAAGWGWSRMSLATVLRHEVGHALGYGHTTSGLMGESLEPGTVLPVPRPDSLPRAAGDSSPMALVASAILPLEDVESASEPEPESKPKADPAPEPKSDPAPEPKADPAPEPKADPAPATEVKAEPK
ncbi:MAG: hypothetical protein WBC14_04555, partial [Propionicimonas sp.]